MEIAIGLPTNIPAVQGSTLIEWTREAEARGFSSLTTIDRVAFPTYDTLVALAAAGAVTSRIGLMTDVLLAPTHNPVLLAKAAASVDQLSGGRFTLGIAVGGREDDYVLAEQDFHARGKRLDAALELMHAAWSGRPVEGSTQPVAPQPVNGKIPLIFGGTSDRTIRRIVKWGAGWTAGGSSAGQAAPFVERVRSAWKEAGREGAPRFVGLQYFSLGEDAEQASIDYLMNYYGFLGPFAERIARSAARDPQAIRDTTQRFSDLGFDELSWKPTVASLDQLKRLADAVL